MTRVSVWNIIIMRDPRNANFIFVSMGALTDIYIYARLRVNATTAVLIENMIKGSFTSPGKLEVDS